MIMNNEQLELSLSKHNQPHSARRSAPRRTRAAWWFSQMRQIVDRAMDWESAPPARPEQTWFPGTGRQAQS